MCPSGCSIQSECSALSFATGVPQPAAYSCSVECGVEKLVAQTQGVDQSAQVSSTSSASAAAAKVLSDSQLPDFPSPRKQRLVAVPRQSLATNHRKLEMHQSRKRRAQVASAHAASEPLMSASSARGMPSSSGRSSTPPRSKTNMILASSPAGAHTHTHSIFWNPAAVAPRR